MPSLLEAQDALFRCDDTTKKQELKNTIESLKDEIVKSQMTMDNTGKLERYLEARRKASRPFVLWQIDFARVFREKGGFDIVIGNPPYVGESGHKEMFREVAVTSFGEKYYQGKMDFFYFFFHKGLDLAVPSGEVALITTNYYPTATGAKNLRLDFKRRAWIRSMINFNEIKVFESAQGQHNMITFLTKKAENDNRTIDCRSVTCEGSYVATSNQITVEVIGCFVWVSGNTRPYKEALRSLGFQWHRKKHCWYKSPNGYRRFGVGTEYSLDRIRSMYGVEYEKEAELKALQAS